jgi:hypothetical protein
MKNPIVMKTDPALKKMMDEIRLERLRSGKNDTLLSYRRLTLAMSRIPNLKKILMESEIKDVRK